jgi:hypothetical protein
MEHGPFGEAISSWDSQILCLLCDQNIHYHIDKNPPLDSIQTNAEKVMHLYYVKYFILIFKQAVTLFSNR